MRLILSALIVLALASTAMAETPEEGMRVLREYQTIVGQQWFSERVSQCEYKRRSGHGFWPCYLELLDTTTTEQRLEWRRRRLEKGK